MNELNQTIGENLRAIRLSRRMNQRQFAEVLGLPNDPMAVSRIERGERDIPVSLLGQLCERLDVSVVRMVYKPVLRANEAVAMTTAANNAAANAMQAWLDKRVHRDYDYDYDDSY